MNDYNYITIHGWMLNKLELPLNEALLFALIFGFSQDGQSEFTGSVSYIEETLKFKRTSIHTYLNHLLNKNLIIKNTKPGKPSSFKVNLKQLNSLNIGVQNLNRGVQNLNRGCSEFEHNNNIYNNNYKTIYKSTKGAANKKHIPQSEKEYEFYSDEEIEKLMRER